MQKSTAEGQEESWDLILRPKNKWYQVDLKGIWQYRDLLVLFVRRDFLSQYKQTILGPAWMLLQPLVATLTFTFMFGVVAHIPTGGIPRVLFYLSAYVPWIYFSDCLTRTSSTFVTNAGIFGKVYFPRLVTPVSGIFSNLFKYLVQLALFIAVYLINVVNGASVSPNAYVVFFPLLLLMLSGYGLAIGLIVSSLTTKYRDLSFLVGSAVQLMMYASSVVFSIGTFGPQWKNILRWNPLLWIIEAFRFASLGVGTWSWPWLGYSLGVMLVLLFIAVLTFSRVEKNFMDTV